MDSRGSFRGARWRFRDSLLLSSMTAGLIVGRRNMMGGVNMRVLSTLAVSFAFAAFVGGAVVPAPAAASEVAASSRYNVVIGGMT